MLAVHLSTLGYRVFAACLDVTGEGASKLRKTSSNIAVLQLDVTSDEQVAEARRFVENQLQGCGESRECAGFVPWVNERRIDMAPSIACRREAWAEEVLDDLP